MLDCFEGPGGVQVVIQVSGSGVTPFVVPQQTILLRAMASVLTTVSLGDLSIRYVTSAVNQRRRLLSDDLPHQVSFMAYSSYDTGSGEQRRCLGCYLSS